ncbi:MAG: hypothetical protein KJO38_10555, partial [Gammaproteobacteria bacterium]|nr:hypothetical protein [Gammaproteobacteria bacterium]
FGGARDMIVLQADVPATAPYTAKHVLDITGLSVNGGGLLSNADNGLHAVAYLGDTTANAAYSSLDGTNVIADVLARQSTGFAGYRLIDPRIIADVNRDGRLTSADAGIILTEVSGFADRLEIPPLPDVIDPIIVGGPDPLVSIESTLAASAGETVTVPVNLDITDGLESLELQIGYDPAALEIVAVRTGAQTAGFVLLANTTEPGLARIDASAIEALGPGSGVIIELDVRVAEDQAGNELLLDLRWAQLNEGNLVLNPVPAVGADPTDGTIVVAAAAPVVPEAAGGEETLAQRGPAIAQSRGEARVSGRLQHWLNALSNLRAARSASTTAAPPALPDITASSSRSVSSTAPARPQLPEPSAGPAAAATIDWAQRSRIGMAKPADAGPPAWQRGFLNDAPGTLGMAARSEIRISLPESAAADAQDSRPAWRRWLG